MCLHRRTSLCRKLPAELKEKLVASLSHVIGHSEKKNYLCTCYVLVLADGSKFPPHVIQNHKKVPKEQLHRVPVVRCQHESWVEELVVGGVEQKARGCQSLMHFRDM